MPGTMEDRCVCVQKLMCLNCSSWAWVKSLGCVSGVGSNLTVLWHPSLFQNITVLVINVVLFILTNIKIIEIIFNNEYWGLELHWKQEKLENLLLFHFIHLSNKHYCCQCDFLFMYSVKFVHCKLDRNVVYYIVRRNIHAT